MKKIFMFALLATSALCLFNSCEDDSMKGTATYYGVVIDENTDTPFAGVDVKVTNGDKIHTSTQTTEDGTFSVEVRLAEINKDYYILIGNTRMETKRVDLPAYGNGSYNVGTIIVKGPTTPTVETTEASNITSKTATAGGKVTSSGGYEVTRRGVCWSDRQYPDVLGSHTEDGTGNGEFMSNIFDLQPNTTYYIRAYAENEKGIAYGNQVSFKTESGIPKVETLLVRVDSKTAVFCEGNVTDEGASHVIAKGICWGTSTPTIANQKTNDGDGTGSFSTSVTVTNVHSQNLYFRAFATNEAGTAYGEPIMIDHRNPYNLFKVSDQGISYLVLPYDLACGYMGGSNSSSSTLSDSGNTAYTSCQNLVAYDYDDWTLPTLNVLKLMYQHKEEIGGFLNDWYWSSTLYGYARPYNESYSGYCYYYLKFSDGEISFQYHEVMNVRPVRQY